MFFSAREIATGGVKSLLWSGDRLVDWAAGAASWSLDGKATPNEFFVAYRFDQAISSPDGRWVFLHERLGTKGVLLEGGRVRREIDRSFYCANAYDFPALLLDGPDASPLLVHCPREHSRLELEDARTGRALTPSVTRKPAGFFHSQLTANPSGTRFASAGWIWHPQQQVAWFELTHAILDPRTLDRLDLVGADGSEREQTSAAWLDDDLLLIGCTDLQGPHTIELHDLAAGRRVSELVLDEPPGLLMPLGKGHVVAFYKHPRLISLETGKVLHAFTGLDTGLQQGSIAVPEGRPPLALDPRNARFAALKGNTIQVVQFDLAALEKD